MRLLAVGFGVTVMNPHTKSLLLLVVAVAQAHAAIYDHVSQLPTHTYDYIVVGGTLQLPHTTNRNGKLIHGHY